MKKALKIFLILALAVGWMFCIYKLSGMNSSKSNGKSADILSIIIADALDVTNDYGITDSHPSDAKIERASTLMNTPMRKVMHASVYLILAFFLMILLNIISDHKYYWLTLLIALVLSVVFAITDEYHQTFVAGRTGQKMDVIIDSLGALIGLIFYTTYNIVYKNGYRNALKEIEENKNNIQEN